MSSVEGQLTGLVAATFTPFTPEGDLNVELIGQYIDYLVEKQGVRNVFVNGTTGEGCSLTLEERKRVAEQWCLEGKGKLDQIIIHVGCLNLKDSQELACHAALVGADGIALISPFFFKPTNAEALRMFLREVGLAAPDLPLYYYHLPSLTGVNMDAREILEGIEKQVPSFRGMKFSATDLLDLAQCLSYCQPRGWSVMYGVDEQLLGAVVLGVRGAVGSTYNYLGRVMNIILDAFNSGDITLARNIQLKMQDVIAFAKTQGFGLAMNKQVMSDLSGLPLGPPRLPLLACPPAPAHVIAQKFRQILDN